MKGGGRYRQGCGRYAREVGWTQEVDMRGGRKIMEV